MHARPSPRMSSTTWSASDRTAAVDLVGRRQVVLVGRLAAVRPRDPRGVVDDVAELDAAPEPADVRPVFGPNSATSGSSGSRRSSRTVSMPSAASRSEMREPMPHSSLVGRSPITSNQLSRVSRNIPRGLPKSVAILARTLVSPMPTEQCRSVAAEHVGLDRCGRPPRGRRSRRRRTPRPSRAPRRRRRDRAQRVHHHAPRPPRTPAVDRAGARRRAACVRRSSGIPERTPNSRAS